MLKNAQKHLPVIILLIFSIILSFTIIGRHVSGEAVSLNINPTNNSATWLSDGKLNINKADADAFTILPGIGHVISQRIIDYRQLHGEFEHINELLNVKGIGNKTLNAIAQYITIGD